MMRGNFTVFFVILWLVLLPFATDIVSGVQNPIRIQTFFDAHLDFVPLNQQPASYIQPTITTYIQPTITYYSPTSSSTQNHANSLEHEKDTYHFTEPELMSDHWFDFPDSQFRLADLSPFDFFHWADLADYRPGLYLDGDASKPRILYQSRSDPQDSTPMITEVLSFTFITPFTEGRTKHQSENSPYEFLQSSSNNYLLNLSSKHVVQKSDYVYEKKILPSAAVENGQKQALQQPVVHIYNFTLLLEFNPYNIGKTTYNFSVYSNNNSTPDYTLTIEYILAGIAVVYFDTNSNTYRDSNSSWEELLYNNIISGPPNAPPLIFSYKTLLHDPLVKLRLFYQYPDGTNSTHVARWHTLNVWTTKSIDIQVIRNDYALINYNPLLCQSSDSEVSFINSSQITTKNDCPINAYVNNNLTTSSQIFQSERRNSSSSFYDQIYFDVLFQQNRSGNLSFQVLSPGFADYNELIELFVNFKVIGKPPITIVYVSENIASLHPAGRESFTILTLYWDPLSTYELYVNGKLSLLQRVTHMSNAYVVLVFSSPPGTGCNLDLQLIEINSDGSKVEAIDNTGTKACYTPVLLIHYIKSSVESHEGNFTVLIFGEFYPPIETQGPFTVWVGNCPLNPISFNSSVIFFTMPSRKKVLEFQRYNASNFSFSEWDFPVSVRKDDLRSNDVTFSFLDNDPDTLSIRVEGGRKSLTNHGVTESSPCASLILYAVPSSPIVNVNYEWVFKYQSTGVVLHKINNATMVITDSVHPDKEDVILIELFMTDAQGKLVANARSYYDFKFEIMIGVSLYTKETRYVAVPKAAVRVIATIDLGTCSTLGDIYSLMYLWTFQDKKYLFSHYNSSVPGKELTTPNRIGRELYIPPQDLKLGLLQVNLEVYVETDSRIYGKGSVEFIVEEGPIISKINNGQMLISYYPDQDLLMSAENSVDLNSLDGTDIWKMQFAWSCQISLNESFQVASKCANHFLPSPTESKFFVSQSLLQQSLKGVEKYYLRYSLHVSKDARVSNTSTQIIEVKASNGFGSVDIAAIMTNSRGEELLYTNVPYFDSVIFSLNNIEKIDNLTWSFQVLSPNAEANQIFVDSGVLIQNRQTASLTRLTNQFQNRETTQIWIPLTSVTDSVPGLPVRIKPFSLIPETEYTIAVKINHSVNMTNRQIIKFKTMPPPKIISVTTYPAQGPTGSMFTISVELVEASMEYLHFFFATNKDGYRFCLGSCSGKSSEVFTILDPGSYSIECKVFDSRGTSEILTHNVQRNLTVVSALSDTLGITTQINPSWMKGRFNKFKFEGRAVPTENFSTTFEDNINRAVRHGNDPLFNSFISTLLRTDEYRNQMTYPTFQLIISNLEQIVKKSLPNTNMGNMYMWNLGYLMSVNHLDMTDENIYTIMDTAESLIMNTPDEENVNLMEPLTLLMNLTYSRAFQRSRPSTTRRRLNQADYLLVNQLLLDVSYVMKTLLLMTDFRNQHCGYSNKIDTQHPLGAPNIPGVLENTVINTRVWCDANQISEIIGDYVSFLPCEEILDGEKKHIFLLETPDYVSSSEVQSGPALTQAKRLFETGILTKAGSIFVDGSKGSLPSCHRAIFQMDTPRDIGRQESILSFLYTRTKNYKVPIEQYSGYLPRVAQVVSSRWIDLEFVEVVANAVGLIGARKIYAQTPLLPDYSIRPTFSPMVLSGIIILILIFIIIATITAWLIARFLIMRSQERREQEQKLLTQYRFDSAKVSEFDGEMYTVDIDQFGTN